LIALVAGAALAAEPQEVAFSSGKFELRGFIYTPAGSGPFRAILYNHGSEQKPGWKPELGQFFSDNGYVFFVPHRRSHGRSPRDPQVDSLYNSGTNGLVALHETHLEDQLAALDFLRRFPGVDRDRIAVAGCSFGGIQTILALEASADRNARFRAAVDFAGGAQTWRFSSALQERMIRAVRKATVPVMFVQAENDYDLSPSYALAKELENTGKPHKLSIYPAYGNTVQDGHGGFCFRGVAVWGPDVLAFLDAYLKN
jgi:dipeptidyl aminopeptidase/acylaminoacyl peptidase